LKSTPKYDDFVKKCQEKAKTVGFDGGVDVMVLYGKIQRLVRARRRFLHQKSLEKAEKAKLHPELEVTEETCWLYGQYSLFLLWGNFFRILLESCLVVEICAKVFNFFF